VTSVATCKPLTPVSQESANLGQVPASGERLDQPPFDHVESANSTLRS
jgi:hypothetical protein